MAQSSRQRSASGRVSKGFAEGLGRGSGSSSHCLQLASVQPCRIFRSSNASCRLASAASNEIRLSTVAGEAHCSVCGLPFFDGDEAYCLIEEDNSLLWFCEEHVPPESDLGSSRIGS